MANEEIIKRKFILEMEDKVQGTINKINGAVTKLQESFKRTEELGENLGSISKKATEGFGIVKLAENAINAGESIYQLSTRFKMSAKEAQNLNSMLSLSNVDTSIFLETVQQLDQQIQAAGEMGNSTSDVMTEFGINLKEDKGNLLSYSEQLERMAEAYKKAEAAGKGQEFANKVLGPSGEKILPALTNYEDNKIVQQAIRPVELDTAGAHTAEQNIKILEGNAKNLELALSNAFIPVANEILPKIITLFQGLVDLSQQYKSELQVGAKIVGYAMEAKAVVEIAQTALETGKALVDLVKIPIKIADRIANPGAATSAAEGAADGASAGVRPMSMMARTAGVSKLLGRAAVPVGVAMDAYDMYKADPGERTQKGFQIAAHWGGALAGGKAGVAAGVAIGSLFPVPVVGTAVGATIGGVAGGIAGYFAGDKIGNLMGSFFVNINWTDIKTNITTGVTGAFSGVNQAVTQFGGQIATGFEETKNKAITWAQELPARLGTFFSELPGKAAYGIGYIIGAIRALPIAASTFFSQLWQTSTMWVDKTVNDIVTWFSRLPGNVATWWQNTCQEVEMWVVQLYTSSVQWVMQTINDIGLWFTSLPALAQAAWSGMWQAAETWCSNTYSSVVTWFCQIPTIIETYFNEAIENVKNKAAKIWDDVKAGFTAGVADGSAKVTGSVAARANGGIFDRPQIALFAEDGAEAIIPLSSGRRSRGIELWQQAGSMLGMTGSGESLGASISNVWNTISTSQPMQLQAMPAIAGASGGDMQLHLGGIQISCNQDTNEEQMVLQLGRKIVKEIKQAMENRG